MSHTFQYPTVTPVAPSTPKPPAPATSGPHKR
jgi:hypothetical protein